MGVTAHARFLMDVSNDYHVCPAPVMRNRSKKALAGLRVVEYAGFVAGPYCAKLLADMGAEVVKVEEPAAGDDARRWGPFRGDAPHPEKSGLFLYLNTNKLGMTLNPRLATGREVFLRLAAASHIVIEDSPPGVMEELGLGYQALSEANPALVMVSITPFGQKGPYAGYKGYYLNTYHSGMLGHITPVGSSLPDREPLKSGGLLGEFACGLVAAVATLGASYARQVSGHGQHVDVSKQEALVGLGRMNAASFANGVRCPSRTVRLSGRGGMIPCRDGHVCVHIPENHQWAGLVEIMGFPEWATDERYKTTAGRMLHLNEVMPRIREWASSHTKEEIYHPAQRLSSTVTPVMTAEDVVNSQQAKARGFIREIEHPEAGGFRYPTSPFLFSRTPWTLERPAPCLGEHNEEILVGRLGFSREELAEMAAMGVI